MVHFSRGVQGYNPSGCDGCREIHHFLTEPDYRGDKTIRCTTESILTGSLDQTILSGRPDGLAGRCSTFSVARLFLGK
jgi:hypothetical protein